MVEIEDNVFHEMTVLDIENHVREVSGLEMNEATISHITDRVIEHIEQWKVRKLDRVYMVMWMDAIKVRHEGKVTNKAVKIAIGLNNRGYKWVLGMRGCQNESAAFWMGVLTNLKKTWGRGHFDYQYRYLERLCCCNKNNLSACQNSDMYCTSARNSLKFVVWKDKNQAAADLRLIYNASDAELGLVELNSFDEKWGHKYPYIVKSWNANWGVLIYIFEFPEGIRMIIYTTNLIENVNRGIRKYTKAKSILPNDQAVEKVVYLSLMQAQKK